MDKYTSHVLNKLLDHYEASKTFTGDNQKNQSFSLSLIKEFPKYTDDSDFDTFESINASIKEMERQSFIYSKKHSNGVFTKIFLNVSELEKIYSHLKRTPKHTQIEWLTKVFETIITSEKADKVLKTYANVQKERIKQNKKIEFHLDEKKELKDVLQAAQFSLENKKERFMRDASIELFGDSKRLEQIQSKVQALLFAYGDFAEREYVLEELGIVRTPTYIMMKGNAVVTVGGQNIYLNELAGDIAFSTKTVEEIDKIQVLGEQIITIENLTAFHSYAKKNDFCIYLGGFHNQLKQKVIMQLYQQNSKKSYFHFGDIDAGGFYIYEHLRRKTEIKFQTMYMDVQTLEKYQYAWKPLSNNDRIRLEKLKKNQTLIICHDTIDFMLKSNCKLEQEAIG